MLAAESAVRQRLEQRMRNQELPTSQSNGHRDAPEEGTIAHAVLRVRGSRPEDLDSQPGWGSCTSVPFARFKQPGPHFPDTYEASFLHTWFLSLT